MGINFPPSPTVGDLYPVPPQAGVPQYKWDGTVWVANVEQPLTYVKRTGDTMTGILALSGDPVAALDAVPKQFAEARALDAMGYSGMQINGSMEVSQERGQGNFNGSGYSVDGWNVLYTGTAVINTAQYPVATGVGFVNVLASLVPTAQASMSAGDFYVHIHRIEGCRTLRLQWGTAGAKPITLAFWTAHQRPGTYSVVVRNNGVNRSYTATYTQNAAGVYEYKVITIPGCTDGTWDTYNLSGIQISFAMACGATFTAPAANAWYSANYVAAPGQINGVAATSDVFRITGVVVLPGIYAPSAAQSPLIMRPYGEELVTCKRYWERVQFWLQGSTNLAGLGAGIMVPIPIEKRAAPTITQFAQQSANYTWSAWFGNIRATGVWGTVITTGQYTVDYIVNVDARL